MCYAKPGPRCSGHTRQALESAKEAVDSALSAQDHDSYIRAREDVDAAQDAYDRTPEGIESLRADGEDELANQYEQERADALDAYKRLHGSKDAGIALYEHPSALEDAFQQSVGGVYGTQVLQSTIDRETGEIRSIVVVEEKFYQYGGGDHDYSISDFSDPATVNADLEAESKRVKAGEQARIEAEVRSRLDEKFARKAEQITGKPGAVVDLKIAAQNPKTAEAIRSRHEKLLERKVAGDITKVSDQDLETVSRHPLSPHLSAVKPSLAEIERRALEARYAVKATDSALSDSTGLKRDQVFNR